VSTSLIYVGSVNGACLHWTPRRKQRQSRRLRFTRQMVDGRRRLVGTCKTCGIRWVVELRQVPVPAAQSAGEEEKRG
jgi:hypothetical protein